MVLAAVKALSAQSGNVYMKEGWGTGATVSDFISLGSKFTADSDCSHEIKRYLLLEGKL